MENNLSYTYILDYGINNEINLGLSTLTLVEYQNILKDNTISKLFSYNSLIMTIPDHNQTIDSHYISNNNENSLFYISYYKYDYYYYTSNIRPSDELIVDPSIRPSDELIVDPGVGPSVQDQLFGLRKFNNEDKGKWNCYTYYQSNSYILSYNILNSSSNALNIKNNSIGYLSIDNNTINENKSYLYSSYINLNKTDLNYGIFKPDNNTVEITKNGLSYSSIYTDISRKINVGINTFNNLINNYNYNINKYSNRYDKQLILSKSLRFDLINWIYKDKRKTIKTNKNIDKDIDFFYIIIPINCIYTCFKPFKFIDFNINNLSIDFKNNIGKLVLDKKLSFIYNIKYTKIIKKSQSNIIYYEISCEFKLAIKINIKSQDVVGIIYIDYQDPSYNITNKNLQNLPSEILFNGNQNIDLYKESQYN